MKNKNENSTRYYSDKQEKSVCKAVNGRQQTNSGAGHFNKGDVITDTFLIECKCVMKPKDSVSIKREWVEKNKNEAFSTRKPNQAICINFEPDGNNYYLINERLFSYLVSSIEGAEND